LRGYLASKRASLRPILQIPVTLPLCGMRLQTE
jgi:hypothetical protein